MWSIEDLETLNQSLNEIPSLWKDAKPILEKSTLFQKEYPPPFINKAEKLIEKYEKLLVPLNKASQYAQTMPDPDKFLDWYQSVYKSISGSKDLLSIIKANYDPTNNEPVYFNSVLFNELTPSEQKFLNFKIDKANRYLNEINYLPQVQNFIFKSVLFILTFFSLAALFFTTLQTVLLSFSILLPTLFTTYLLLKVHVFLMNNFIQSFKVTYTSMYNKALERKLQLNTLFNAN